MINNTRPGMVDGATPLQRVDPIKKIPIGPETEVSDYQQVIFVVMVIVGTVLALAGMGLTVLWLYRKRHNIRDLDMIRPLRQGSSDSAYSASEVSSNITSQKI